MHDALTAISTSPAPGMGMATARSSTRLLPGRKMAFMGCFLVAAGYRPNVRQTLDFRSGPKKMGRCPDWMDRGEAASVATVRPHHRIGPVLRSPQGGLH